MEEKLLKLMEGHKRIALAGAGGKTTTLLYLGSVLANAGKSVLCFTTTHIETLEDFACPEGMVLDTTKGNTDVMSKYNQEFDYYIYEADGSKGHPIKTPNETEPVILPDTDLLLVLMGLDALGKSIEEGCHRYQRLLDKDWAKLLMIGKDSVITESLSAMILADGYGKMEPAPYFLLNQADDEERAESAKEIAKGLEGILKRECAFSMSYPIETRNRRREA